MSDLRTDTSYATLCIFYQRILADSCGLNITITSFFIISSLLPPFINTLIKEKLFFLDSSLRI